MGNVYLRLITQIWNKNYQRSKVEQLAVKLRVSELLFQEDATSLSNRITFFPTAVRDVFLLQMYQCTEHPSFFFEKQILGPKFCYALIIPKTKENFFLEI